MPENLTLFYIMAGFVAFLIGLSKGGLGGMPGALATPLMMLVMPAKQVIGLLLPILMFADVFAVAAYSKNGSSAPCTTRATTGTAWLPGP
jgi:uncharacterized membrane protein YfcA